jgi:uncharacterized protein YjiS (DUF1127 family)
MSVMVKNAQTCRVVPPGRSPAGGDANRAGASMARSLPFAAMAARLVRRIRAEMAARRAIGRLSHMSELGLHDLGLTRGDVERVARHGRF